MAQPSRPFALVVRFIIRPGCEIAFDDLVSRTADGIRAREPGTLVYACHKVEGAARERIIYELYANRAAFEEHNTQVHTRHFLANREALVEATHVDFLNLADGKIPFNT